MEKNEIIEEEKLIEETPEPQEPKEKTRLEQFVEKLRVYSTQEEAKTHIQEIATEIGCAKSLGYKAIKKILKEGGFSGQPAPKTEAKEPTAKVEDVKPEPLEETQETEFEETTEAAAPETPTQPAALPMGIRSLQTGLKSTFKVAARILDYPEFALTEDESGDLANAWFPVMQFYAPQLAGNPLVWAAISTGLIVAPRIAGYIVERRKKAKDKPLPEVKKPEPPSPEPPKQEPPKEETPPPLEANDGIVNPTQKPRPTTAPFMVRL